MMRSAGIVIGTALLVACISRPGGRDNELARSPVWNAVIEPTDGGTVHGQAVVVGVEGSNVVRAVVTIEGSKAGAVHPWDIHTGVCGTDGGSHGAVVGRSQIYPMIPIGGAGAATMQLELPVQLVSRGSYFINVHDSPARHRIVACGTLVPDRGAVAQARTATGR